MTNKVIDELKEIDTYLYGGEVIYICYIDDPSEHKFLMGYLKRMIEDTRDRIKSLRRELIKKVDKE